jgi:ATP/maltotriose-dependent transcriptional regulator MalT
MEVIDRLPPGSGVARRREQLIDKVTNRGTLISTLAYGGYLAEARTQGEAYLARFKDATTMAAALGAIADAHGGLAVAYAYQGEPVLARQSYAAAVAAYQACDNHALALRSQREELILAVLPYQADDLAGRERIVAETERMAAWVLEHGGHANPDLPRYARIPLLVLEGEWHEARLILEQTDAPDVTLSLRRARAFSLGTLARAQGNAEMAWRCVHEPWLVRPDAEPGGMTGGALQLHFQLLAAGLALDAGDLAAARGWLDLHRRWLEFMDRTLGRADGEVLEAEWHRAAGDAASAREHAKQALALATTPRQPLAFLSAHRMLGILATDAGERAAAEEHFSQALTLANACRAPYERALTLTAHAELLLMTNDHRRAHALLDEARALCLPLDAAPALAQIERLAAQLDRPTDRPPAGLTAREVEVLRLVAAGLSNTQIAQRLFVSPNTVKVHLTRILAKIGVPDRVAATEFARQHGIA